MDYCDLCRFSLKEAGVLSFSDSVDGDKAS